MSAPFMQLYVADYLGDTRHLTTEQHGAYLLLLMTMWRSDGVLPADDAKLARIAGLTVARWKKIGDDIMAFFTPCEGGITQGRLVAELTIADEKSEKRSRAGKAGGRAKALKDKKSGVANAKRSSWHSPEPEPDTQTEDLSVTHARASRFDEWWGEYPGAVAKPAARQAYEAARVKIGGDDPDAVLLEGLRRSVASDRWANPTYTRPNPARWLAEERWNDREAPAAREPGKPPPEPPATISPAFLERRLADLAALKEAANA